MHLELCVAYQVIILQGLLVPDSHTYFIEVFVYLIEDFLVPDWIFASFVQDFGLLLFVGINEIAVGGHAAEYFGVVGQCGRNHINFNDCFLPLFD